MDASGRYYSHATFPHYPLNRRFCGPQSWYEHFGDVKIFLNTNGKKKNEFIKISLLGFELQTLDGESHDAQHWIWRW
jgi:hypothetical protein